MMQGVLGMARTTGTSPSASSMKSVGTEAATEMTQAPGLHRRRQLGADVPDRLRFHRQDDDIGIARPRLGVVAAHLDADSGSGACPSPVGIGVADGGPGTLRSHQALGDEGFEQDAAHLAETDDDQIGVAHDAGISSIGERRHCGCASWMPAHPIISERATPLGSARRAS